MKSNKYIYKINIHKKSFSKKQIIHCRYRSGHITQSYFNNALLENVDFIGVNLKNCKFKNTLFTNCFFFNCDFTGSDFSNAKFKNTYFCACKFSNMINLTIPKEYIIKKSFSISIKDSLKQAILSDVFIERCERFRVLTITNSKINSWVIGLLLNKTCTEEELLIFIKRCSHNQRNPFITFHDYQKSLEKYYQRG